MFEEMSSVFIIGDSQLTADSYPLPPHTHRDSMISEDKGLSVKTLVYSSLIATRQRVLPVVY